MIGLWFGRYRVEIEAWILLLPILLSPAIIKRSKTSLVIIILIGLSLGLVRGQLALEELSRFDSLIGRNVTLTGKVLDDASYDNRGLTEFHVNQVDQDGRKLPGKMRISGYVSPYGVERGDQVEITGKIREGFGSYQASISFAKIVVTARQDTIISRARNRFFASIYTVLPEPQASLGLGFLIGLRALLPEDLLTHLSRTGLTHIVAVSGYNLTILVRVSRRSFMKISKFSATAISVGLILLFLMFTGLAPSIFRASIVAAFALAAWYYGRPIRPMMLLGLSGAITAGINPFFIWFDVGWWLSFTAFFGVLVLAPVFTERLFKKTGKELFLPLQIAIETTCAQIMALPIIMVVFGELSLISVVANILVVPFIPVAMLATFVAGISEIIVPSLAGWLAIPATIILVAMSSIIVMLSSISWALISIHIDWSIVVAWYCAVLFVYWIVQKKLTTQQRLSVLNSNVFE